MSVGVNRSLLEWVEVHLLCFNDLLLGDICRRFINVRKLRFAGFGCNFGRFFPARSQNCAGGDLSDLAGKAKNSSLPFIDPTLS